MVHLAAVVSSVIARTPNSREPWFSTERLSGAPWRKFSALVLCRRYQCYDYSSTPAPGFRLSVIFPSPFLYFCDRLFTPVTVPPIDKCGGARDRLFRRRAMAGIVTGTPPGSSDVCIVIWMIVLLWGLGQQMAFLPFIPVIGPRNATNDPLSWIYTAQIFLCFCPSCGCGPARTRPNQLSSTDRRFFHPIQKYLVPDYIARAEAAGLRSRYPYLAASGVDGARWNFVCPQSSACKKVPSILIPNGWR